VKALYIVHDETLWLIESAKKNGVSKEDFLLWYKENQPTGENQNADNKSL
jgi:hypothetical protein